jgi:hypothetical protein
MVYTKKKQGFAFLVTFAAMLNASIYAACENACATSCNISAHTTFIPRWSSQNSALELSLFNYRHYHPACQTECGPWFDIEVIAPYGFVSTRKEKTAEYFLPGGKQQIVISQNNDGDISSPWLRLMRPADSPYLSYLSISPKRTVVGGALRLVFDGTAWFDGACWYHNWWATIFIPVQHVRHTLDIKESIAAGSGSSVAPAGFPNAIAALNNPAWLYGKLSPNTLKKTGVDDISVKVGLDFIKNEEGHFALYGQLFIPTGKRPHAQFLFEPLVGGNHTGLGAGLNADLVAWCDQDASLDLMVDMRYAYFFKGKEIRSIDLFNGDWSRYLLVAEPDSAVDPLPGINFFTQEVSITPRSMFELWAAFSFNTCNWHFEAGYDFWYRAKEKIKLANKDLGVGIYDFGRNLDLGQCTVSSHCAQICASNPLQANGPIHDPNFITVKNDNAVNALGTTRSASCQNTSCSTVAQCSFLNLDSAAHPRAFSSMIYLAASRECCCNGQSVLIGVGGSYEFAHRRSALSGFGAWFKTAFNF